MLGAHAIHRERDLSRRTLVVEIGDQGFAEGVRLLLDLCPLCRWPDQHMCRLNSQDTVPLE
jgi:hypothetical protein